MINLLKKGASIPRRSCWVADLGMPIEELQLILKAFTKTPLASEHSIVFTLIPTDEIIELYCDHTIRPFCVLGFIFGWEGKGWEAEKC